jgi:hypothetical protein
VLTGREVKEQSVADYAKVFREGRIPTAPVHRGQYG